MRAVALADETVQEKIAASFIPLKVKFPPGTKKFPLDWPALKMWRLVYGAMGNEECVGITACTVISPDLAVEYASTGSAFVWLMFESIAYDPVKFAAMLDRAAERARVEREIRADPDSSPRMKKIRLRNQRLAVAKAMKSEGPFRLPPKGFTINGAFNLFRMTGDLPPSE